MYDFIGDPDYGGALVSKEQLVRLEGILEQFPTTADVDAQLLAGTGDRHDCLPYQSLCTGFTRSYEPALMPTIWWIARHPVPEIRWPDRWCSMVASLVDDWRGQA